MAFANIVALLAITAAVAAKEEDFQSVRQLFARRLSKCDESSHEESCKCMMGCEVMGGDSSGCSDDKEKNAELTGTKALGVIMDGDGDAQKKACDLMMCAAYCAKSLDCMDDDFKKSCEDTKENLEDCK